MCRTWDTLLLSPQFGIPRYRGCRATGTSTSSHTPSSPSTSKRVSKRTCQPGRHPFWMRPDAARSLRPFIKNAVSITMSKRGSSIAPLWSWNSSSCEWLCKIPGELSLGVFLPDARSPGRALQSSARNSSTVMPACLMIEDMVLRFMVPPCKATVTVPRRSG